VARSCVTVRNPARDTFPGSDTEVMRVPLFYTTMAATSISARTTI
jgi:hypothetical protein